jgi:hypothetical protein
MGPALRACRVLELYWARTTPHAKPRKSWRSQLARSSRSPTACAVHYAGVGRHFEVGGTTKCAIVVSFDNFDFSKQGRRLALNSLSQRNLRSRKPFDCFDFCKELRLFQVGINGNQSSNAGSFR